MTFPPGPRDGRPTPSGPPESPAQPLTRSHGETPADAAASLSGPPTGPSGDWADLTARIAEQAHAAAFDNPDTAAAIWPAVNQDRFLRYAAHTIRAVLVEAAGHYEADIRATRHIHPRAPLPWPHRDLTHWLRTAAGRAGTPAQTEPGS